MKFDIKGAKQNMLLLRDETAEKIIKEVCEEKNIPVREFLRMIFWAYTNRNKGSMQGITALVDEILENME